MEATLAETRAVQSVGGISAAEASHATGHRWGAVELATAACALRPRDFLSEPDRVREIEIEPGAPSPRGPARPGDRWLAIVEGTGELVEIVAIPVGPDIEAADNGMGC